MAKSKVQWPGKNRSDTYEEALQSFLFWKQAQGISKTTLKDYRKHIGQFFNRYPRAYSPKYLKPSILEYMAQQVKPATYNLRLAYLKNFFNCVFMRRYSRKTLWKASIGEKLKAE